MNTDRKPLIMLDVEAADKAQARLSIGDTIEYTCDGVTRSDKLIGKTAFSVTVQQATCRLAIPIELTTVYQTEKEQIMAKRPTTSDNAAQPSRGRPRQSMPPAAHPSEGASMPPAQQLPGHDAAGNLMLPPGSPAMPTGLQQMPPIGPVARTVSPTFDDLVSDNGRVDLPGREVTIHQVQGDPDWIGKAVDDAIGTFNDTIHTLILNVVMEAAAKTAEPQPKTCFQCVHIDIENNLCSQYNMVPPFSVLAAPEGKCTEFVDGSVEIPM